MPEYTIFNRENAPEKSQGLLENSHKAFGMVPNLHGVMAASPALLEGYQELHRLAQETSFNAAELTVVWQSINVEHNCHYCVPAHTGIAHSMKVDGDIIESLRNETPLKDEKLEALRTFTLKLARNRGVVSEEDNKTFFAAGYGQTQVLDIILILAQKVMSNYTNHVANTPLDQPFQKFDWTKSEKRELINQ